MLLLLRQNSLQLDMVLTKLFKFMILHISLSLLTLHTQQEESLISLSILISYSQLQSLKILESFLIKNSNNSINFWDCLSSIYWNYYSVVDKETKQLKYTLIVRVEDSGL